MERDNIIKELKKYFKITELVCPHTYNKHGENSWKFLDTESLETLLVLRTKILCVPLICNSYSKNLTQRGFRCNLCELNKNKTIKGVLSISAHSTGKGWDLTSPNMTAEEMRKKIKAKSYLLPYPVRIEKDIDWLHIDCYNDNDDEKITYFNK